MRAHVGTFADIGFPLEESERVNDRVKTDRDRRIDVGGGGIHYCDPFVHPALARPPSKHLGHPRKLSAGVDAQYLLRVSAVGDNHLALRMEQSDGIGEIVLALRVFFVDLVEYLEQFSDVKDVNAGVYLVHRAFLVARVMILDDPLDLTDRVPDDTPVLRGVRDSSGQYGRDRSAVGVDVQERVEGLRLEQWRIPGHHENGSVLIGGSSQRGPDRIPRSPRRILHNVLQAAGETAFRNRSLDLVSPSRCHDHPAPEGQGFQSREYVRKQWTSRRFMHHFGHAGLHPRPLTGGKHDGCGVHLLSTHAASLRAVFAAAPSGLEPELREPKSLGLPLAPRGTVRNASLIEPL